MTSPFRPTETPSIRPSDMSRQDADAPRSTALPEVVLADPDPVRASRVKAALTATARVVYAAHLSGAVNACRSGFPSVVLVPFGPAAGAGFEPAEVLSFLRAHARQLPVIVYADSAKLPMALYCQPLAAGAKQILNEKEDGFVDHLRATVERLAAEVRDHRREQEQLGELFASYGLMATSAAMRDVFRRILKASYFSDLPVLLLGETGTGKQRVAEAIHALDPVRRDKPFVTLNCGALSKSLAESELFGHAKGAFSGAQGERKGLFRAANGGTLLLDEIGELDPELQPKLLRVLQEQRLLPVGEDYEHAVDVRVIAATHRSLETMIAQEKFREDLYQRLNVFRISIPPLRQRPEDVEIQAAYFLQRYGSARTPAVTTFGPRVVEALRGLPWEGNTRQLENFLREALALKEGDGDRLELVDLPRWAFEKLATTEPPPGVPAAVAVAVDQMIEKVCADRLSFGQAVEDFEARLLRRTLEMTQGNRTHAAQRLGLTPRTVFAKIKKYQLE